METIECVHFVGWLRVGTTMLDILCDCKTDLNNMPFSRSTRLTIKSNILSDYSGRRKIINSKLDSFIVTAVLNTT